LDIHGNYVDDQEQLAQMMQQQLGQSNQGSSGPQSSAKKGASGQKSGSSHRKNRLSSGQKDPSQFQNYAD